MYWVRGISGQDPVMAFLSWPFHGAFMARFLSDKIVKSISVLSLQIKLGFGLKSRNSILPFLCSFTAVLLADNGCNDGQVTWPHC